MQDEDYYDILLGSKTNTVSIHFEPLDEDETDDFVGLLMGELAISDLSPTGNMELLHRCLKSSLKTKEAVCLHQAMIEHMSETEGTLFFLMQVMPCVLHMKNRVGLKLLKTLLDDGLSQTKGGQLYPMMKSEEKRIEKFLNNIQGYVSKKILGKEDHPAHWHIPDDKQAKMIPPLTLDNTRVRTIVNKLMGVIDLCIIDPKTKTKWKTTVPFYRTSMVKLCSRNEMSNEDITSFQSDFDKFWQIWVKMRVAEGVSNYLHKLAIGHVSEYLF
jgi:hypothetical protein